MSYRIDVAWSVSLEERLAAYDRQGETTPGDRRPHPGQFRIDRYHDDWPIVCLTVLAVVGDEVLAWVDWLHADGAHIRGLETWKRAAIVAQTQEFASARGQGTVFRPR